MELFAITCTTCKTRLKVRDASAIGQILSCPKCGGMVMVKPPPAFSEVGEQRSDLPTATEVEAPALDLGRTPNSSAFEALDELLSDAPPRVQRPQPASFTPPPTAPTTPKPRFVGGPPHRSSTPPVQKASATPPPPPATPQTTKQPAAAKSNPVPDLPPRKRSSSSGDIPTPPADVAPPPAPESAFGARPRTNYWLLMAASIVLGIGLALIGVCAVILLRPSGQQSAHAATPAKKPSAPPAKQSGTKSTTSNPAASQPASQPEPTASTTTPEPPAPTESPSSASTPPATNDPLGLATTPPTPAAKAATPTTDPLSKFDNIIGGPGNDPLSKPATSPTPVTSPPPPTDNTPARPIAPRPPPREVDVVKRLNDQLLGIEVPSRPLAEFVQLLSDLSTIPITLDVPFPPTTSESAINLKSANTTLGKALTEALASVRLEYVINNDQLIIRRPEPTPVASLNVDVKDLTAGDEQQTTDLVELLQAVIEPGTWGAAEGQGTISIDAAKGTLAVRHRRTVQFQLLIATEKLRAAHSPPLPFKTKLDPVLFKLDSRLKQAGPKLAKPISLNYGQPTRLVEILDRLGQASGLRILVDWRDIASAGWNPAGEAKLVVSNQDLADAIESLLAPLDLTIRIIDAQTLQVVTPARLAEQGELEFYKVADLVNVETTADALLTKIRASLGDEAFIANGGNGEIRFDDATKCLLAWLPQPKQWHLEAQLTKWREGK